MHIKNKNKYQCSSDRVERIFMVKDVLLIVLLEIWVSERDFVHNPFFEVRIVIRDGQFHFV